MLYLLEEMADPAARKSQHESMMVLVCVHAKYDGKIHFVSSAITSSKLPVVVSSTYDWTHLSEDM